MQNRARLFFVVGILTCALLASPPAALALGLVFALLVENPYPEFTTRWSKLLLQASVVGLGFGMNLGEVLSAGRTGFLYTFVGISFAVACGMLLGRMLMVRPNSSTLISVGTAICGGSAIAAVGPVLEASEDEMAVALATIFILNAIALFTFPVIGRALDLSQHQFGLWAALAIHDTSSVVGATAKYGSVALAIATTVKLTRALWIVPVTFAVALFKHRKTQLQIPWFILLFLLAACIRSYSPTSIVPFYRWPLALARIGLAVTLFLIGSTLSRRAVSQVGIRPLLQGVVLWIIVAISSLWLVKSNYIR